ncbi:Ubiquitin-conjugating enzyme, E2 [Kalmanozyma brasiliensis GHG001]|uniref:Ubiquitin-conjugating enzyme, E2 n=1 Tax=Kalmanozyma brasiliensis (strain GHG001) TaxID=1365824 RepID=UPI0028681417|nr:Ubiquitin-conjugating enzyme, E2 [Kalmanozyma brasiliensis GHG001]KAF6766814.1 Ubiquitin-conjugating enzyme, E2 [Kalmanozyma brasiliensis GHG001]
MPSAQQLQQDFASRDISFQYSQLCLTSNSPSGIYVSLDDDDTHLWHGVIFVSGGPFNGGIFRFDIVFPASYPSSIPQVFFPPTLLHPLVDPDSGRLLLLSRFPTWNPRRDFVSHILHFVKSAFEEETLEGLLEGAVSNKEVYRMFRGHRGLFDRLAMQSVALSTSPSSLYDVSGGSGFPNSSVQTRKGGRVGTARGEEANGVLFRKLDEDEMIQLRREIFGDGAEAEAEEG